MGNRNNTPSPKTKPNWFIRKLPTMNNKSNQLRKDRIPMLGSRSASTTTTQSRITKRTSKRRGNNNHNTNNQQPRQPVLAIVIHNNGNNIEENIAVRARKNTLTLAEIPTIPLYRLNEINIDDRGRTALLYAAIRGDLAMCMMLVEHGADINKTDNRQWTPLMEAAGYNHPSIVEYLLNHGANPELRDRWDKTALHWAAFAGADEVIQLFARRGIDLFPRDSKNRTPADVAREKYRIETSRLFYQLAGEIRFVKQAKFIA
jgi:ankyrin repeat protein